MVWETFVVLRIEYIKFLNKNRYKRLHAPFFLITLHGERNEVNKRVKLTMKLFYHTMSVVYDIFDSY